jgi:hypothetical protein
MTPEELLRRVVDRDSFIAFVTALAAEREEAERMEREEPVRYQLGGAHNWQNGTISSFLGAALVYFQPTRLRKPEETPSWRMMADFLYYGKIYE